MAAGRSSQISQRGHHVHEKVLNNIPILESYVQRVLTMKVNLSQIYSITMCHIGF
uniref:Uncharacterized protein n=2 Tax=Oryza sativa subsp. japonica TaxID=39947 RepID=Q2R8M9_ORYSJ|nr:hypothetical protein LOC_Os11g11630 [Oryza sativa Japonica Group]ABA92153.1 hypothetical protein LOC_Os11g11630 [Oryza sativa Japonica Group]